MKHVLVQTLAFAICCICTNISGQCQSGGPFESLSCAGAPPAETKEATCQAETDCAKSSGNSAATGACAGKSAGNPCAYMACTVKTTKP